MQVPTTTDQDYPTAATCPKMPPTSHAGQKHELKDNERKETRNKNTTHDCPPTFFCAPPLSGPYCCSGGRGILLSFSRTVVVYVYEELLKKVVWKGGRVDKTSGSSRARHHHSVGPLTSFWHLLVLFHYGFQVRQERPWHRTLTLSEQPSFFFEYACGDPSFVTVYVFKLLLEPLQVSIMPIVAAELHSSSRCAGVRALVQLRFIGHVRGTFGK